MTRLAVAAEVAALGLTEAQMKEFYRLGMGFYLAGQEEDLDARHQALLDQQMNVALAMAASGIELAFPEVLERIGEYVLAERLRTAVDQGRNDFMAAAKATTAIPLSELCRRRGEPERFERALVQEARVWAGWPGMGGAA